MQELITKNYKGAPIEFELIDGQLMANATAMCAAFGKRAQHFLDLASTQRYIKALQSEPEFPAQIVTRQNGPMQGTWIHERLILKLAQWIDVDFEIWCDKQIAELLRTGKVELAAPADQDELILMLAQRNADHSRHLRVLDAQQKVLEAQQAAAHLQLTTLTEQVAVVAAKQTTSENGYYTVAGYASLLGKRIDLTLAKSLGSQAKALSTKLGILVDRIKDPRFGKVNMYHEDVLRLVFGVSSTRLAA